MNEGNSLRGPQPKVDLPRIMFGTLFIALMIVSCFWVVRPFVLGFAWASMIVIATWPLLTKLQEMMWGKRWLSVLVMMLLLILLFVIPISLVIVSLIDNSAPVLAWASSATSWQLPDLAWLNSIPLVGSKLYSTWHSLMNGGGSAIMAKVQPYIGQAVTWFIAQAAHVGSFMLHCTLMLLFSALLYSRGEHVALGIRHFAIRLAAQRGDAAVILAAQSIRAVALGVVVTALAQSVLGGIGLAICGISGATLLTVVMFICCLAQLGPLLVLVPAIIWLYWTGDTTWGTVLLVWSCVVGTMDGVLRPALIRLGADLPMILILSGVIGGLLAFGMIGLFIGPVVLAVSYRLISAWIHEAPEPDKDPEQVIQELEKL
ncbi:AI-2E family transporter YdiK [Enterobacillus tribolii]|uniref:Putative PurR-regulated permease PerM n=1 Tax=Enterobacillus tribolii TaxID=1487935 RepID=A0A370R3P2_9GAMM|nr:AI-2E family transporter YdiK [Enterobacillus tribolii]MBW7984106.1 AI-2E family transporter YdiK [Enterobacillus tribolii]RDK97047.1 putative PurR-regulated permease PerM [Enterobacillus tribolii]